MKTKNNNNEVVTRGILTEAFDEFGKKFGTELLEKIDVMIDTKLDVKLDKAIGDLAIMIQDGFMATAKQEDLLALTKRVDAHDKELKKINNKLDATLSELKQVRI